MTNCKQPRKSIKELAQTCDWVGCSSCCSVSDLCAEHYGKMEKGCLYNFLKNKCIIKPNSVAILCLWCSCKDRNSFMQ